MISPREGWILFICLFLFNYSLCQHIGTGLSADLGRFEPLSVLYEPINISCSTPICEGPLAPIYCSGPLIATAWSFGLQAQCPGPKMKFDADVIIKNFNNLSYPMTREKFDEFCKQNFAPISYLELVTLPDYVNEPAFIKNVKEGMRSFALNVHQKWQTLARIFVPEVRMQKLSRFPVLPVPNPFIVPGGFFQVYFYWDSYWIIKGLLVSDMTQTVRGILDNFAYIIDYHGFIPNSGNIQLSRRSQPPFYTQMVLEYYNATKDIDYLRNKLPVIEKEMQFWRTNRTVQLPLKGNATLYQYKAITTCPRPENYQVDLDQGIRGAYAPEETWSSIASACESGWDFSSRWFDYDGQHAFTKYSIRTNTLIPVDLNAYMALNFKTIAIFHELLGNKIMAAKYRAEYNQLVTDIDTVLWNDEIGVWMDYDMSNQTFRRQFYPSNVFPLLAKVPSPDKIAKISKYLNSTKIFDYKGGVPSSLPVNSSQQWDFPNVWAPNVHLTFISLLNSGDPYLQDQARSMSRKFVHTVKMGVLNPPEGRKAGIWEKYDARRDDGTAGGGGEYDVQEGFGWTNGAVLDLIYNYKIDDLQETESKSLEVNRESEIQSDQVQLFIIYGLAVLLGLMAVWFAVLGIISGRASRLLPFTQRDAGASRALLDETEESDD